MGGRNECFPSSLPLTSLPPWDPLPPSTMQVLKNIERGEVKLQRFQDNQNAVAFKLAKYRNPWVELKVRGGGGGGGLEGAERGTSNPGWSSR